MCCSKGPLTKRYNFQQKIAKVPSVWSVAHTFVSKILRNILNLHVDILKTILIFCLIFWFVKNFHLSEILRKTAEISAPSIFQGIQFFFWDLSPKSEKKFCELQNRSSFGKKMDFCQRKSNKRYKTLQGGSNRVFTPTP